MIDYTWSIVFIGVFKGGPKLLQMLFFCDLVFTVDFVCADIIVLK